MKAKENPILLSAFCGGTAGCIVDFIYFPLETIKTRIQASSNNINYRQIAQGLSKYRGFSLQMLSAFPFASIFFGMYDLLKLKFGIHLKYINKSYHHMLAAAIAETTANVIRSPFEVVKQQQQVGYDKNITETVKKVIANKGIKGFYAGFASFILRDIPFSAIQFTLYEKLKQGRQSLTFMQSSSFGFIAGSTAAFLTTPMDVIKTKLMTQREGSLLYKGTLECFRNVIKEEGIQSLWKGTLYRTLPLGVTGTVFFCVYEQTKNLVNSFLTVE